MTNCSFSEAEKTRLHTYIYARVANAIGGCLEWTRGLTHNGYGRVATEHGTQKAHRVSWALKHGPIPEGMFVLHTCDNRKCVNPNHLRLGTHQENMADMLKRNRQAVGERQHKSRLTAEAVKDIRTGRLKDSEFARLYGVNHTTVYEARIGRYWKHVA